MVVLISLHADDLFGWRRSLCRAEREVRDGYCARNGDPAVSAQIMRDRQAHLRLDKSWRRQDWGALACHLLPRWGPSGQKGTRRGTQDGNQEECCGENEQDKGTAILAVRNLSLFEHHRTLGGFLIRTGILRDYAHNT